MKQLAIIAKIFIQKVEPKLKNLIFKTAQHD